LGLTVIGLTDGGAEDVEGIVQFEARYRGGILKETSLFKRRDGSAKSDWLYVGALKLGG
jgi:SEC-C motif-containing protein